MSMPVPDERASVVRRVRALEEEGLLQLPKGIPTEPRDPLAVQGPDGRIHSWMVPFIADGRLVAWAQIGRTLELLRFSLLGGGRVEASPDSADWLDPGRVSARIAEAAGSNCLMPPVLTYDRDPSRLVWTAETEVAGGGTQRWYVAGTAVWRDTGAEDVTGGGPPRSLGT